MSGGSDRDKLLADLAHTCSLVSDFLRQCGDDHESELNWMTANGLLARMRELLVRISRDGALLAGLGDRHPSVQWSGWIGMANTVLHGYEGADREKVYKAFRDEIPDMHRALIAEVGDKAELGVPARLPDDFTAKRTFDDLPKDREK